MTSVARRRLARRHRYSDTHRLVVFSRLPIPGATKTRLIPVLGAKRAAGLQREMTRHTLATAKQWAIANGGQVEVRFTGGSGTDMAEIFGRRHRYVGQGSGDLGERLARAFADAFHLGSGRVVCIGSDCPSIDTATLQKAFEHLESCDVVVGPATDGGYYLIGLRSPAPSLFMGVDWGTNQVLSQTRQRIRRLGLSHGELAEMSDVDEPRDLAVWQRLKKQGTDVWKLVEDDRRPETSTESRASERKPSSSQICRRKTSP